MARPPYSPLSLGPGELDAIREIGTIGAGHAATALSRLIGAGIDMTVPRLTICSLAGFPAVFFSLEDPAFGVMLPYGGDLEGHFLLLFPEKGARSLEKLLLPGRRPVTESLRDSALKETASIMAGAFLTVLSRITSRILLPSPPIMVRDMTGAIIDEMLAELGTGTGADEVLTLDFSLNQRSGENLARTLLIPDPTSLSLLLEAAGRLQVQR